VSVQVAEVVEVEYHIGAGAAVAGGGAYMQTRVEEVGLGYALSSSVNVVTPVACLVLLGQHVAAKIIVLGEVRAGVFAHAADRGVVGVLARAAVHLADAACAIERVLVESVIQQVSGSVVVVPGFLPFFPFLPFLPFLPLFLEKLRQ
jgi:hypothetical protein